MSMDAGSTRVSIGSRIRTTVALLVAAATVVVGAAPAVAATKEQHTARRTEREVPPTEIGRPATVVVNRVEQTMRDSMTGVASTVSVLDARRRAEEAERFRAAVAQAIAGASSPGSPSREGRTRRGVGPHRRVRDRRQLVDARLELLRRCRVRELDVERVRWPGVRVQRRSRDAANSRSSWPNGSTTTADTPGGAARTRSGCSRVSPAGGCRRAHRCARRPP